MSLHWTLCFGRKELSDSGILFLFAAVRSWVFKKTRSTHQMSFVYFYIFFFLYVFRTKKKMQNHWLCSKCLEKTWEFIFILWVNSLAIGRSGSVVFREAELVLQLRGSWDISGVAKVRTMGGIKPSKFITGRCFLAVDVVAQGSRVALTSGTPLQNVILTFYIRIAGSAFRGLFQRFYSIGYTVWGWTSSGFCWNCGMCAVNFNVCLMEGLGSRSYKVILMP